MTLRNISRILLAASTALVFAAPAGAEGDAQAQIFQFFMKRAESGDASAQFIVAERYAQGKGAPQSTADASKWYAEAAKNGHPMAQQKLQEITAEEKKAMVKAPAAAAAPVAAVPIPPPAPKPVPVAPRPPVQAKVVPTAPAAKPAAEAGKNGQAGKPEAVSSLDTAAILLSGKWQKGGRAAEALPSDANSCLRTSEREIVCFSDELRRSADGKKLTYIVKSTLTDFANDGRFNARYVYNVTDIAKGSGPDSDDAADILAKSGWQEPGHVLECRAADAKSINCLRDKKQEVRFSR